MDYDSSTKIYYLMLRISDGLSSHNLDIEATISLDPVNEDTPTFSASDVDQTIDYPESTNIGTVLVTMSASDTDHDPHDIDKYEIFSGK